MIEIKKLTHLSLELLKTFGDKAYSSDFIYEISRNDLDNVISFKMNLLKQEKTFVKFWPASDIINNDLERKLNQNNSFGSYETDKLTGFVINDFRKWNNSLWIEMILVKEDCRTRGAGSLLLKATEELAIEKKIRMIELETQNTNVPAIKFYKKNGYEFTGLNISLYDPAVIKDETAIFMSKNIQQKH